MVEPLKDQTVDLKMKQTAIKNNMTYLKTRQEELDQAYVKTERQFNEFNSVKAKMSKNLIDLQTKSSTLITKQGDFEYRMSDKDKQIKALDQALRKL